MPNFYGHGRSNYVFVTDKEKVKELATQYGLKTYENDNKGMCFISMQDDGGASAFDEETDEELDAFEHQIAQYLKEDQIFVWMQTGAEGERYVAGWATATNSKGETIQVSLQEIYQRARDHFGRQPQTMAEY